jgi:endonuclease YncB( thermonuclease family)
VAHADPCEAPLPAPGAVFSGEVRYIGDGDSLCVGSSRDPAEWIEVRLADFYAPELSESGGDQAKAMLSDLTFGARLRCVADHRSYDRIVARCTLNGESVGSLMRRHGAPQGGRGAR